MKTIASYWVYSELTLREFCTRLQETLKSPAFEVDYENRYEWGITHLQNGRIELNISRDFQKGADDTPFHIFLTIDEPTSENDVLFVDIIGQITANLTGKTAHLGIISYIGDEKYSYTPDRLFQPVA